MLRDLALVPPDGPTVERVVDRRTGRERQVEVPTFEIAATVVTVHEWDTVAGRPGGGAADSRMPKVDVSWREAVVYCNARSMMEGLTPAYAISRDDHNAFATGGSALWNSPAADDWHVSWDRDASGYRLPSDAEWQVACRAGVAGPRYGELDEIAWFADNSGDRLRPVAAKRPNAWGLYDTLGGVWEWCWDLYDVDVYGAYRVIRGGGWSDPPWSCRAQVRRKTSPSARLDDLGFRVARSVSRYARKRAAPNGVTRGVDGGHVRTSH